MTPSDFAKLAMPAKRRKPVFRSSDKRFSYPRNIVPPPEEAAVPNSPGECLPHLPLHPPEWRFVLLELLRRHNRAHGAREKGVSFRTMQARRIFLFSFFRQLRQDQYRIDPRSLGSRHIEHAVSTWLKSGLSTGTIRLYLSFLRVFSTWIGKPGLVLPPEKYVDDPKSIRRCIVAKTDKSWTAKGIDIEAVLEQLHARDCYVAAQLMMSQAFGLRVKEAVMCRPHLAVTEEGLLAIGEWELERYLEVKRGTKGGRLRHVPIDGPLKERALEYAKSIAKAQTCSLADPRLSLKQALNHFYYVIAKVGLTKSQLGVTAHGLRHQYGNDRYEQFAGEKSPVRGGQLINREVDRSARESVAQELGHSREEIVSAYCGPVLRK